MRCGVTSPASLQCECNTNGLGVSPRAVPQAQSWVRVSWELWAVLDVDKAVFSVWDPLPRRVCSPVGLLQPSRGVAGVEEQHVVGSKGQGSVSWSPRSTIKASSRHVCGQQSRHIALH